MPQVFRVFWGRFNGRLTCTFNSPSIDAFGTVLIAVSEGDGEGVNNPNFRFVGAANIRVENIAPVTGKVVFIVNIDWGEPLPIWTDIVILDGRTLSVIRGDGP